MECDIFDVYEWWQPGSKYLALKLWLVSEHNEKEQDGYVEHRLEAMCFTNTFALLPNTKQYCR